MGLIIGNILSLAGQAVMSASGLVKDRLKTLLTQIAAMALLAAANAVLGGLVGCLINVLGIVRNITWYSGHGGTLAKIGLSAVTIALSIWGADHGWLWLLPMASALLFLWAIDLDGWKFKALIVVTTAMWIPYDLAVGNYVALLFDVAGASFNAFTAMRLFQVPPRLSSDNTIVEPVESNVEDRLQ